VCIGRLHTSVWEQDSFANAPISLLAIGRALHRTSLVSCALLMLLCLATCSCEDITCSA